MKYSSVLLLFLFIISCSKEDVINVPYGKDELADFECVKTDKSINITTVQKHIYGRWKLGYLATMLPTKNAPDIEVVFKDVLGIPLNKQVADIYIKGDLIGSVIYTLKEDFIGGKTFTFFEEGDLTIGNTEEYNFIRGGIRICEDELLIDNGMAVDGPGYFFYKLK